MINEHFSGGFSDFFFSFFEIFRHLPSSNAIQKTKGIKKNSKKENGTKQI